MAVDLRIHPVKGSSLQEKHGTAYPGYDNVIFHGLMADNMYVIVQENDSPSPKVTRISHNQIECVFEYEQGALD